MTESRVTSFGDRYSSFYDALYKDKDYAGEVSFLAKLLTDYGISHGRLLDFGCGTGNHLLRFAELGYEMTGIDSSKGMLECCQKKALKTKLSVKLVSKLPSDGNWDAIMMLFAVVNYLESKESTRDLFRKFYQRLKPKGLLFIECWNGIAVPLLSETSKKKKIRFEGAEWTRITDAHCDWLRQTMEVRYRFLDNLSTEARFEEKHLLYDTPHELIRLAQEAGFELRNVFTAFEAREARVNDFNLLYIFARSF